MGCPYCGGPIPPKTGRGRQRKFCSEWCCKEYNRVKWYRENRGLNKKMENCKNCGKLLKYNQTDFCSEECQKRYRAAEIRMESHLKDERRLQMCGINKLRFAVLKQAKWDGCLERWSRTPAFYKMFPELTPDMMKKGESI